MDKNLNRISFRPDLLEEYPRLKDFFTTVGTKDRAKALLAMSEAFAITYASEGTNPQQLFYLAESIRSGNVPLAVRTDKQIQTSNNSFTPAKTFEPEPLPVEDTQTSIKSVDGGLDLESFLNS